ncbi:hypothetical protein [Nocardia sp. NBC_01329]|uniref:hypothetical protein n=1 Tax=Nocardia sp. NBC_01329 TaxID=2903594 RepID=UPI002E1598C3|nr:hypothetical protein OG405_08895 [Nocardia sp. NBC_01329]
MSASPGSTRPDPQTTFYDHAVALARRYPDIPLPREGEPYPDEDRRAVRRFDGPSDDRDGARTAQLIDDFFRTPIAQRDIARLCRMTIEYQVPIHRAPAVVAAIGRADRQQVLDLGRHLTRTSTDTDPTVLGMAILAEVGTDEDIPLIRTIGLLSDTFGPLAAEALARLPKPTANLIRLTDRVSGWGRVYLVEAVCGLDDPLAHPWLLRKPCDGDFLNGYFAEKITRAAPVHEAIAAPDADEDVVDHTGRLLSALVWSQGTGGTIIDYRHAEQVLTDYLTHTARLTPNLSRYRTIWSLARFSSGHCDFPPPDWPSLDSLRTSYWSLVTTPSWLSLLDAAANSERERDQQWASDVLQELDRHLADGGDEIATGRVSLPTES